MARQAGIRLVDSINRIAMPRRNFGRRAPQVPARPLRFDPPPAGASAGASLSSILNPVSSPAEALPEQPVPLERERVIARSSALMGRNGLTVLALVAAAAVPERAAYHILETGLLSLPLTLVGCMALYAAVFDAAMRDLKGEPRTFIGALGAARVTPLSAYKAIAMTVLAVWWMLIVPATGRATRWALAAPVAIAEGKTLSEALARSTALTEPARLQVRRLVLLLAGLAILRALAMLLVWSAPAEAVGAFILGDQLFPLLLTAFTAASGAVLYRELCQPPA
jgi:hypothetical protein